MKKVLLLVFVLVLSGSVYTVYAQDIGLGNTNLSRNTHSNLLLAPYQSHTVVTPQQCDGVPKYWCAFVQYIAQTGSIVVDIRAYKGAIDYGETEKWRLLYYKDYVWSGACSCYTLDQTFGPSTWRTNTGFPPNYWAYSENNTLNASAGLVKAKFEYKRAIYVDGWYWYSSDLYFWLNSH